MFTRLSVFFTSCLLAFALTAAQGAFVINEFDSDTRNTPSTDYKEFVELKGNPGESADGLVLVWFNGGGATGGITGSYVAIDLTGYTADANGFLLLGTTSVANVDIVTTGNTLQNGEDAIALYTGTPAQFPLNTQPTSANLIDYVVYQTSQSTGPDPTKDWSAFGTFTVLDENKVSGVGDDLSLQRIRNDGWDVASPTPKAENRIGMAVTYIEPIRVNQTTAAAGTTRTLTLRNERGTSLTVTSFQPVAGSDPTITSVGPDPVVPCTLAYNQSTTFAVEFKDLAPVANRTYSASWSYATDNPTSPTGTTSWNIELIRSTTPGTAGAVKINEICYDPTTNDFNHSGGTVDQDDEFIELFNTTDTTITLEGWEIRIYDATFANYNSFIFPVGATLPANGFVAVFAGATPTGFEPGTAYTGTIGAYLYNPGSHLSLNDGTTTIEAVAYLGATTNLDPPGSLTYENVSLAAAAGKSYGRRPDGVGNWMVLDPIATYVFDRPSPAASNNTQTAARDWSIYE